MKDKLRELAEMVREAYRAGFIAACKWPSPVSQDVDSPAYTREFNDYRKERRYQESVARRKTP